MSSSSEIEVDEVDSDSGIRRCDSLIDVTSVVDKESKTQRMNRKRRRRSMITTDGGRRSMLELDAEGTEEPVPPKRSKQEEVFGGYTSEVRELRWLLSHIRQAGVYTRLGVEPPKGLLLHGPRGSGKTLLANTLAKDLGLTAYTVPEMDLLTICAHSKIRYTFERASLSPPALIILDGLDALEERKELMRVIAASIERLPPGVMVIATCVSPESICSVLRLPGKFDREIALGVPSANDRMAILDAVTTGMKLEKDLSMREIAELTPGFVGGDLKALASEAGMAAVARALVASEDTIADDKIESLYIERNDFVSALKRVQPSSKRLGFATVPEVSWDDVGSLKNVRRQLEVSILLHISHAEEFKKLGLEKPAGILLCGPPGCGKTLLAKAISNEAKVNFLPVKGPELMNSYVGESERAVRTCFQRASACRPCVIFFDEIDSLCPRRYESNSGTNTTARVVNQFLTEMDGLEERTGVYVLAATNRPDMLDPALLRPGRLDKMIWIGLPTPEDRVDILRALTRRIPLQNVSLESVARDRRLNGFSGADLSALVKDAAVAALTRHIDDGSGLHITTQDILEVASKLRPSVTATHLNFYKQIKQSFEGRKRGDTDKYTGVS